MKTRKAGEICKDMAELVLWVRLQVKVFTSLRKFEDFCWVREMFLADPFLKSSLRKH